MNVISLFTGSGMLDRSVEAALWQFGIRSKVVCYIEQNQKAQEVIRARVRDGLLRDAPIWPDVVTFPGGRFRGYVDAVVAGFPCQPFSVAGKKLGTRDERYLFADVVRIADESDAGLLFLENTPGLLIPDPDRPDEPAPIADVSRLMAQSGFDAAWLPLSAEDVGAPHGRERWWCIAWRELVHSARTGECRSLGEGRGGGELDMQIRQWATPQAHDVHQGDALRVGRFGTAHGGRNLTDDVHKWQTPSDGNFRTRGGDRADEMGLDNQVKQWPTARESDANGTGKHGTGGRPANRRQRVDKTGAPPWTMTPTT